MHCAANLDDRAGNALDAIDAALDRAAAQGVVVELYAHRPGSTVSAERIEHVLAGARDRGLAFYTYADLAAGRAVGPGLALSFDDASVRQWHELRPMFQQHAARLTFFVSRYPALGADVYPLLRDLQRDGHDVAAHGILHLRAPAYVEDHGLAAYLEDEAVPSIELLRADGYPVTSFAYPFGARTSELDEALLAHVSLLRSVVFALGTPIQSPCPR